MVRLCIILVISRDSIFIKVTNVPCTPAIKQRMEKDVDEVGKVARYVKTKVEELDREVSPFSAST